MESKYEFAAGKETPPKHTKIKHICDFIYLTEGCVLAVEENSIYCWRDLNRLQKDVAFCGVVF